MRHINKLIIPMSVLLSACGGDSNNSTADDSQTEAESRYRLTFNATWNSTDFPTNFPSNPHFSPVIGATHNDQDYLWRTTTASTPGIEQVAETGATGTYRAELEQKKTEGNVDTIFVGSGVVSPGSRSLEFDVNSLHPYVSAITMIAPSPDWFIGIRDVNLYENGEWLEQKTFDLKLYDAGTDVGAQFSSANEDGGTGIIELLTSDVADTDIEQGVHRETGLFVGQFILERIETVAEIEP